jgi:hypothetical protein
MGFQPDHRFVLHKKGTLVVGAARGKPLYADRSQLDGKLGIACSERA